jgi:hypothetical protein
MHSILKKNRSIIGNLRVSSSIFNSFRKEDLDKNFQVTNKSFALYIPRKQLFFITHPVHGKVYPVYIADKDYNKKNDPAKLMPFLAIFSGLNLFLILSGFQWIPLTKLYTFLFTNDYLLFTSVFINCYLLKRYFNFLITYRAKIKSLYLLPEGNKIIIETFDGTINKMENYDIYECNVKKANSKSIFVNNDNNLTIKINWGRGTQNVFSGRRHILDYEILSYIIHRYNIDTSILKFKEQEIPIDIYTSEEKRKVLKLLKNRKFKKRLTLQNIRKEYYKQRKLCFKPKKLHKIKEEYKIF